ncbi:probable WRKY transcription factor 41 [Ananas comosus]|uniref:Probable WRKY transcription factor 41 n=1 Tax=Ananas comosus TaxID=4615 RepID=A0A199W8M9_ANACO|nr:probable WRKY transcription factor 41 [Ananas comosus]OAY85583.1 putative WRKY transcription factor 41 [Ananas comosus]
MENTFSPLIAELTQIKELMMQLEAQLDQPFPIELSKSMVSKALLATEKSICMANKSSFCCPNCGPEGVSPPHSASGSPRSEGSDHASKFHERREFLKKRKALPTWRSQVKVGAESGFEAPLDDGYSWRKYGQKDILGAKYPRGYYRCTHKNTQGCAASKQVQRTDEDPTVYDVTYHGVHTCQQRPHPLPARAKDHEQITHRGPAHVGPLHPLRPGLAVKTEGAFGPSSAHEQLNFVPFAFPSTTIESSNNNNNNNNIYFSSHAWEDCFPAATVGGGFSPSFASPATSESNYFSPPLRGLRLHKSESDLTEVISAATSTTNSPMADMDFMLDGLELHPSFHLDASSFFS